MLLNPTPIMNLNCYKKQCFCKGHNSTNFILIRAVKGYIVVDKGNNKL